MVALTFRRRLPSLALLLFLAVRLAPAASLPDLSAALPPGGTVRALAADAFRPGRVLLGTMTGSVFVSNDRGAHWRYLSRIAPHADWVVAALLSDPAHPGRWYAGLWSWSRPDAGGVFTSADGGATWRPLLQGHAVRALALAASDHRTLVAATLDGVYRSQDAGVRWALISPPHDPELQDIESVAIDPRNPADIYVGTWHLPWRTINGGHDWWQMRHGVIDDSDVFSIAVDRDHPSTVYLSACSGIYRSDNRGHLFMKIQGIPYSARRTPALVQDPDHPQTIYAGTTQGLWVTRDGGDTWTRITRPDLSINTVLVLPSSAGHPERILLGTNFAGVFASNDQGASFQTADAGFASRNVSAVASSPQGRYLAVTGDESWGGIFFQPDGTAAWQQLASPQPGQDVSALHWSPAGLLAATARGIYRQVSTPHGPTRWVRPPTAPRDRIYALAGEGVDPSIVFAVSDSGLYRSADGGARWTPLRAAPAPLYRVLALPPEGAHRWLFVAGNGYVLRSPDAGAHFIAGRLSLHGAVHQLAYAQLAGHTLVLAATTAGLYLSRDFGAHWTLCGHGLPAADIRAVHTQDQRLFALGATVGEVFGSSDGIHWSRVRLPAAQEALARSSDGLLGNWTPRPPVPVMTAMARPTR